MKKGRLLLVTGRIKKVSINFETLCVIFYTKLCVFN